ncbi:hypothetical protein CONCODRAFT_72036 [Conidiobolus coronatus NRRL 28638]|uniref:Uncharacterized protein n=1 Tax=Conidiobolus coronatus (strain ATCC 28846 / CBS 209.66 / NRRL 28638) TaxID=796925 RepID=A0A137P1G7_CONC2|nr:hypothetical protein CONCODRAFT_72036 [Conidiobolus coronatus NRRL 28638]|eukprot:KXN68721.1 hypothetical protein CONCODRAFT_72036 [Conidiobolus coronatus NRRL 28638]
MNGEDLVKTDIIKYQPFVVALNFAFETTLNNILFSRPRPFNFKVKGNYHIKEIKEIDWKWKYSEFWSTKFTLVDKNNNGKELARIDELVMTKRLFGSFTISNEVPSELHALILTSACLAVKDVHDSLNSNTDSSGINTYASLFIC